MASYYPAVIETDEVGGFGVFFPDLPGCVSAGDSEQEAAENAAEALLLHLQGMIEDNEPIPAPSRLDQVAHDVDVQEVGRILVPVGSFRLERINVSLNGLLLARIDQAAAHRGQNRSEFLAEAAKRVLADLQPSDDAAPEKRTTAQRVEALVKAVPGLTKREMAQQLFGDPTQQRVNADVNWLVRQGRIISDGGWPARFTPPKVMFDPVVEKASLPR